MKAQALALFAVAMEMGYDPAYLDRRIREESVGDFSADTLDAWMRHAADDG